MRVNREHLALGESAEEELGGRVRERGRQCSGRSMYQVQETVWNTYLAIMEGSTLDQ